MLRTKKKNFVLELAEIYNTSNSIVITHYHSLTVSEINLLRSTLREVGATFKVIKNTLFKIALASDIVYKLNTYKMLHGPTAIAYSSDPISAARGVVEFAKTNSKIKIIGGIINKNILDSSSIEQLSRLPSLIQLRGHILGLINASALNVAIVTNSPASLLARVFKSYSQTTELN